MNQEEADWDIQQEYHRLFGTFHNIGAMLGYDRPGVRKAMQEAIKEGRPVPVSQWAELAVPEENAD